MKKVYEIYTKHQNGTTGWEIKWVRTSKDITTFPLFDTVITVNDFPMNGDNSTVINW